MTAAEFVRVKSECLNFYGVLESYIYIFFCPSRDMKAGNDFFVEKKVKKKEKKNTNYYQSVELLTGTNKHKNGNSYYVYSSIKCSGNVFC